MNRAKRRALAHKATQQSPAVIAPPVAEPVSTPLSTVTPAQLAANRSNAQLSTGAKTAAGREKCSHNAVKTALTILLPTDDVAEYEKLGQIFINHYQPATYEEESLVQSLMDGEWRPAPHSRSRSRLLRRRAPRARRIRPSPSPRLSASEPRTTSEKINALHPFRDGNGRAQREFISHLAQHSNRYIAWENVKPADMLEASIQSFKGDTSKLATIIRENISRCDRSAAAPTKDPEAISA